MKKTIITTVLFLFVYKSCLSKNGSNFFYFKSRYDKPRRPTDSTLEFFSVQRTSDGKLYYYREKDTAKESKVLIGEEQFYLSENFKQLDTVIIDSIFIRGEQGVLRMNNMEYKLFNVHSYDTFARSESILFYPKGNYVRVSDSTYAVWEKTYNCYVYRIEYKSFGFDSFPYQGILLVEKESLLPIYMRLDRPKEFLKWYMECYSVQ